MYLNSYFYFDIRFNCISNYVSFRYKRENLEGAFSCKYFRKINQVEKFCHLKLYVSNLVIILNCWSGMVMGQNKSVFRTKFIGIMVAIIYWRSILEGLISFRHTTSHAIGRSLKFLSQRWIKIWHSCSLAYFSSGRCFLCVNGYEMRRCL